MPAIEKPPIGAPCNGCGLCCRTVICAAGSFSMGFVAQYGERVSGPCPAIVVEPDGTTTCGMMTRPKDYAPGRGSAHDLRAACAVLIGAGIGCDEVGDPPEENFGSKIEDMQERFLERIGRDGINRAVAKWFGVK